MSQKTKVRIICDKGFSDELKEEVKEIMLNKELKLETAVDDEKREEIIESELEAEEIAKIIKQCKVMKRVEVLVNKKNKCLEKILSGHSYKIKTREDEDVKDKIKEIEEKINLNELKLDLKKPEAIIECREGIVKITFKQKKRGYFVFTQPRSLRPNIVNAILRFGGIKKEENGTVIDLTSISPFCLESANINKELKKISMSWSSRITNTMRKNSIIAEEDIKFKHGVINELLKEEIRSAKVKGENLFVFGHFPFTNKGLINEIVETIREGRKNEQNIKAVLILEKKLKEEIKEVKEKEVYQGKKKIFLYKI